MNGQRIGIIGGGLGGLASACTLAARGHEVILLERNEWLGGKAAVIDEEGFRFDMGPTILTVPSVLRRIFSEAHRDLDDYLELARLDPQWRSFFDDGSTLDLCANTEAMVRELDHFAPGAGQRYRGLIDWSQRLHDISERFFFWKSIGDLRDMFDRKSALSASTLRDVLAMRPGRSVAGEFRRRMREPRVAQMLDHFTQYVGSAPSASPAVLCGIAHMQTSEGVWYPIGGTAAVPAALERLARELGVEIHTQTSVEKIVIEHNRVRAIETQDGERIEVSAVISNCDAVRTHSELLGGNVAENFKRRRRYEPACSGVVLYLGLNRAYEHLLHHNFVFSRSPEEEFESIYHRGVPAPDPTCYVCAPARTESNVAPAGGEALYVLVHTPYLRAHHNWAEMLPRYRRVILDKLKRAAGMDDIDGRIVFERSLTPSDIHRRYRVLDGAIYGLASHGRFLGAFKPANRSPDVRGLYLAGGAAHPGPGMPMVMMSGWIAADALDADFGNYDVATFQPAAELADA